MPKRFTSTEKWNDPWFCGLTPSYKLFWVYLCENCNHAGIWNVNWPLVKFHCWEERFDVALFGDRVIVINEEKWFVKKFVLFQQKVNDINELNPLNNCHSSIIAILNKEGILSPLEAPAKGLVRGYSNSKGNGKGKTKRTTININTKYDFDVLWGKYPKKLGKDAAMDCFKRQVTTDKDYEDIKVSLDNFLKSDQCKGDKQFIPHGSTWFNKRWKDWISDPTHVRLSPNTQKLKEMGFNVEGLQ